MNKYIEFTVVVELLRPTSAGKAVTMKARIS